MAVSRRLRFEILRRDNYTCRYCGASAPDVSLAIDHVIPTTLGGADDPTNLVTACQDCNNGKASTSPDEHIVEDVDAAAMLWRTAVARAGELDRQTRQAEGEIHAAFDELWSQYDKFGTAGRTADWPETLDGYIRSGLTIDDLHHYANVTMSKSHIEWRARWRYFCGCCNRGIAQRHEMARRLIEDGSV
jgi:hypothetical protein